MAPATSPSMMSGAAASRVITTLRRVLPDPRVSLDHVAYTYSGVRPLAFEEGAPASKVSRDHRVVVEGPEGRLISVTGTKLTCFRSRII